MIKLITHKLKVWRVKREINNDSKWILIRGPEHYKSVPVGSFIKITKVNDTIDYVDILCGGDGHNQAGQTRLWEMIHNNTIRDCKNGVRAMVHLLEWDNGIFNTKQRFLIDQMFFKAYLYKGL